MEPGKKWNQPQTSTQTANKQNNNKIDTQLKWRERKKDTDNKYLSREKDASILSWPTIMGH
eukprot:scaffold15967_cov146-Skeletonema_marinoi.AAC.2